MRKEDLKIGDLVEVNDAGYCAIGKIVDLDYRPYDTIVLSIKEVISNPANLRPWDGVRHGVWYADLRAVSPTAVTRVIHEQGLRGQGRKVAPGNVLRSVGRLFHIIAVHNNQVMMRMLNNIVSPVYVSRLSAADLEASAVWTFEQYQKVSIIDPSDCTGEARKVLNEMDYFTSQWESEKTLERTEKHTVVTMDSEEEETYLDTIKILKL